MPRMRDDSLPPPDEHGVIDLRHSKGRLSQGTLRQPIVKAPTHNAEIERIRKAVRNLGGHLWVLHQSGRLHGSAGIPDLIVALPCRNEDHWYTWRTCFLEVKVGKDKLSPAQEQFIRVMRDCGQTVLVGGLDELLAWWEGAR